MDIKQTLRMLTEKTGVSGDEFAASHVALELLREYAPNAEIDLFGNVTAVIKAPVEGAKTLMLDAHIDQIGMIVTYIDDKGFVKAGACGGLDLRTMLAQTVVVHGREDVLGVISTLPPHVSSDHSKVPEIGDICIDIGMTKEQAEQIISLGDRIIVKSKFRELSENIVSSPAIDDRSGVCAILAALDMLKSRSLRYDLAICFSAQEETGERGVKQAAYRLAPDEAIAVDVSFGSTPDSAAHETADLGSGVMIGTSAVLSREMTNTLRSMAECSKIPYTVEVMPSSTGTNADAIAVNRNGVKCCTLSIPLRYMHTSIETINMKDIEATARLICEYAGGEQNV